MDDRSHHWRHSVEDNDLHLYSVADLNDPTVGVLVPLCEEDQPYPVRHDRDEVLLFVSTQQHATGGVCQFCYLGTRRPVRALVRA
jgi:hypothetical protein